MRPSWIKLRGRETDLWLSLIDTQSHSQSITSVCIRIEKSHPKATPGVLHAAGSEGLLELVLFRLACTNLLCFWRKYLNKVEINCGLNSLKLCHRTRKH